MRRIVIRFLNLALIVACAFQSARVINLIAADLLTPPPVYEQSGEVHEEVARSEWEARKTILDRNLFGAKLVDDAPPELVAIAEEDVEETKLPLKLEATIAGTNASDSRAAIQDVQSRTSMVLGVGDALETHPAVSIAVIERGRVLLNNSGRREELLLNEDIGLEASSGSPGASASSGSTPTRTSRRARRPSRTSQKSAREAVERLRQEHAENSETELTLKEITAEIERMRDLEAQ